MKVSINKKDSPSVLVGAFVPVGSRHEPDEIKGISHFLEHMMFKGTKTRDKITLKREVEKYGAAFNAWTSEEATFYHINIAERHANVARDIIHDMMNNSVFPQEEVDNERNVILQELQMYEDNPRSYLFEIANKVIFNKTSGLHLPIIGTRETLAGINREKLANYYHDNYKNPIYIEVGAVQEERNKVKLPWKFKQEKPTFTTDNYFEWRKGVKQANMVLSGLINFDTENYGSEGIFHLKLYASLMNGFCGRLFDVIREKNHLVYHVSFGYDLMSCGTAQWSVYAALDADKIDKAKNLILEELTRNPSEEELDFAKNKLLGSHELALDSSSYLGRIVINSIVNHLDYDDTLLNYEKNLNRAAQTINGFIKDANFTNSKLVGLLPHSEA